MGFVKQKGYVTVLRFSWKFTAFNQTKKINTTTKY